MTMWYVASALIWIYIITFLVLTSLTSRRNGQSVWLFGKGKEHQGLPALLFRVSFILGAIYPLLTIWWSVNMKVPMRAGLPFTENWVLGLSGLSLMLAGTIFAIYSQMYMGASWRIGAAKGALGKIVNTGPFGISRNPVFVGQVLLFIGLLFVFPTILQFLITTALLLAVGLQVQIEERVLEDEMGDDYRAYKRTVRRWL